MHILRRLFTGIVTAHIATLISPAGAETSSQGESPHPSITVYLQVSDARFDSYLHVKKYVSANNETETSDEFFYIPRSNSKEREKELAAWRRKFNQIVSAATLSESVQPKISHVKEEFSSAIRAAECWMLDKNRERRITITIIGSASETAIENEYQAASRDFFANPKSFTCKYTYKGDLATPQP